MPGAKGSPPSRSSRNGTPTPSSNGYPMPSRCRFCTRARGRFTVHERGRPQSALPGGLRLPPSCNAQGPCDLGDQAEQEFMAVVISTIQRMYATLKGKEFDDALEEEHPENGGGAPGSRYPSSTTPSSRPSTSTWSSSRHRRVPPLDLQPVAPGRRVLRCLPDRPHPHPAFHRWVRRRTAATPEPLTSHPACASPASARHCQQPVRWMWSGACQQANLRACQQTCATAIPLHAGLGRSSPARG